MVRWRNTASAMGERPRMEGTVSWRGEWEEGKGAGERMGRGGGRGGSDYICFQGR